MIAPAKTGSDKRSKIVVIRIDQINKGTWSIIVPGLRIFIIVEIKFTAPKIEEAPAKCKEKIARSTALPLWAVALDKGG